MFSAAILRDIDKWFELGDGKSEKGRARIKVSKAINYEELQRLTSTATLVRISRPCL
jgi:hypothetical protein